MQSEELIATVEKYGAHNYHPLPVVLTRGKGSKVWDVDGKEYIDFLACYSALNFGHSHPVLVDTLKKQVDKLALCSRAFHSEELALFSKELAEFCGLDAVLPMNSGGEAVETAIKLARKWGYEKKGVAAGKANIIVAENNFHGRTIAVISFSSEPTYKKNFGPYLEGFRLVPFNDVEAIKNAIDENTVGVLIEPVQAEAGILVPDDGYLKAVKALCEKNRVLFMADEIQTGMARTGRDFCFQHENALPDILILGKSLGGGLIPVSAVVSKKEVMDVIRPGQHGSTFGGNPLGAAVGRAVLRLMKDEKFAERSQKIGNWVKDALAREKLPHVKEIRGKGALIGIELEASTGGARKYTEALASQGVLCKETHDYVIRIAPPLVIDEDLLRQAVGKIAQVIRNT